MGKRCESLNSMQNMGIRRCTKGWWIGVMLMAAMMLPEVVKGQELTRSLPMRQDEHSTIREVGYDEWLVLNYNGEYYSENYFTMVSSGGSTGGSLFVPIDGLEVMDFQVEGDEVYFCGKSDRSGQWQGVVGKFELSTFPASEVKYVMVEGVEELRRMEVMRVMKEVHCVMLGSTVDGDDLLMDAWEMGSGGWTYAMTTSVGGWNYHDVAVIKDKVVMSVQKMGDYSGYEVWYFGIPTMMGTSFLTLADSRTVVSQETGSRVLLEHCEDEYFVAVFRLYTFPIIMVNGFKDVDVNYGGEFFAEAIALRSTAIKDVKYSDGVWQNLDILVANGIGTEGERSEIYHLNPLHAQGVSTVTGHVFERERLNSLAYLTSQPNQYVASGHEVGGTIPVVHRYQTNSAKQCAEVTEVRYQIKKPEYETYKLDIPLTFGWLEVKEERCKYNDTPIETKCE